MRILLVGEYSNLHNSLKLGLKELGHEVILISGGDAFKKFPSDINVRGRRMQDNFLLNGLRQLFFRLTKTDLALLETGLKAHRKIKKLGRYDVIQLINEYPFKSPYFLERSILKQLRKQTDKLVILGCGDDYVYLTNREKLPNHPLDFYGGKHHFPYSELYLTKKHKAFHDYIFGLKDLVITTDLDYHLIYDGSKEYYGMIPNPVQPVIFEQKPVSSEEKIVIFHGINRANYYKKGNVFFEEALEQIAKEYKDRVEILTVESLSYSEYIKSYDRAHILLDQCFAVDQGYNALEAMAKGKVVFTGAGKHFCEHYNLERNAVAIHAAPDAQTIYRDLKFLIENPSVINKISENAIAFITKYHDCKKVAERYCQAYFSID
ncbi:MAG: glycosyltransferase [Leeuwenhoekiella sp.]